MPVQQLPAFQVMTTADYNPGMLPEHVKVGTVQLRVTQKDYEERLAYTTQFHNTVRNLTRVPVWDPFHRIVSNGDSAIDGFNTFTRLGINTTNPLGSLVNLLANWQVLHEMRLPAPGTTNISTASLVDLDDYTDFNDTIYRLQLTCPTSLLMQYNPAGEQVLPSAVPLRVCVDKFITDDEEELFQNYITDITLTLAINTMHPAGSSLYHALRNTEGDLHFVTNYMVGKYMGKAYGVADRAELNGIEPGIDRMLYERIYMAHMAETNFNFPANFATYTEEQRDQLDLSDHYTEVVEAWLRLHKPIEYKLRSPNIIILKENLRNAMLSMQSAKTIAV